MAKTKNKVSPAHPTKRYKSKERLLKVLRWLAGTSLPEILLVTTFVLSRYLNNIDFTYPAELIGPIVLLGLMATAVYYLFRVILGPLRAHWAALPAVYLLYSFQLYAGRYDEIVRVLLPQGLETVFAKSLLFVLLLMIACGLFGWLAGKLFVLKQVRKLQPAKVVLFFVLFLFASQVVKVSVKLVEIAPELGYRHTMTMPAKDPSKPVTKPDIYYLVFDRYTNNEALKQQYGYDNSYFTDFLANEGFVTRDQAYANYAFTLSSISSTMAMQYHTELGKRYSGNSHQTAIPYRHILDNPPVAEILKREGYQYNQVSSWSDYTRLVGTADDDPAKSFRLNALWFDYYPSDLARDIINKSVLSPFLKKGITVGKSPIIKYELDRNPYENLEAQMAGLKHIANNSTDKPQFSFAHVLVPHDPYIYNADGSPATYDSARNDNGVDEFVKYTNQITYINKRTEDLIKAIKQASPDAVIILQADEGSYPKDFRHALTPSSYYNPATLEVPKMQQKFGILASYYMPGVDESTVRQELDSSVNAFRFVLSHYLGYKIDMLPDCHFASGNKFNLYQYQLVTDKLTGRPNPTECASY